MNDNSLIKFSSVSLSHSTKADGFRNIVLSDVSFTVDKGEMIYLIGKIGSGKSTLLKSIYGEIPILSGECYVAGCDMSKIKRRKLPYLRRRLGIVFQDYQLLQDRSVYENLRFVLKATGWKNKAEINHRIDTILNLIDLSHKSYKMPHHLSGGEQQRLTIGRALLNNPSVIIADEPTGNLDVHSTKAVMDLFMEIRRMGCAILIATHDLSIIESYPSRTLRFDKGTLSQIDIYSILNIAQQEFIEVDKIDETIK